MFGKDVDYKVVILSTVGILGLLGMAIQSARGFEV